MKILDLIAVLEEILIAQGNKRVVTICDGVHGEFEPPTYNPISDLVTFDVSDLVLQVEEPD